MAPTIGRIVHYKLTAEDADQINRRREDGTGPLSASKDKSGAQVHVGNHVHEGETVPMIVTAVWPPYDVNGQIFLDGNDTLWVKTVAYTGPDAEQAPGQWDWPPKVE